MSGNPFQPSSMPYPTPKGGSARWLDELSSLVQQSASNPGNHTNAAYPGPWQGNVECHANSGGPDPQPVTHYSTPNMPRLEGGKSMFVALKTFPHLRRSLFSLNSARSHIYSASYFGNSKWYSEGVDFGKTALTTHERRKIRFGLKSNVDFLVQLDMHNLKQILSENQSNVERFTDRLSNESNNPPFASSSFLSLMNQVNPKKCQEICTILERVISNIHFGQTMNEYFALDDKIEPAKHVLTEAIKQGPDLGHILRGGSFASCAQVFRHLSSPYDSDNAQMVGNRPPSPFFRKKSTRNTTFTREYPLGFCFHFQEARCKFGDKCTFKHVCSNCKSPNHGCLSCPKQTHGREKNNNRF